MAYIEREPLEAFFQKHTRLTFHKDDIIATIANAPAADVVEVRHGKWLDYADKYDKGMDLRCSICDMRASAFVGGTEDWWDSWKPNYCPNCGAKMDGKDGE